MKHTIDVLTNISDLVSFVLITPEVISHERWIWIKNTLWTTLTGYVIPWLCAIAILVETLSAVGIPKPWEIERIQEIGLGIFALIYAAATIPIFGFIGWSVGHLKRMLDANVKKYQNVQRVMFQIGVGLFVLTRLTSIIASIFLPGE
jgi:hypothetical protein